jgi:hypothetical protein
MYMRLKDILEGICIRKDGESDEDYLQRCGNELTREPDMYNDRETSNIKLQKLMAKKKLPKDMKWNQGFTLEANEDINKPSSKLRPEPHPTRHETEHPPYEKDAMKKKGKFTPPTLKEESKEELEKMRNKLYGKALKMFANSPKQLAVRKEIDAINQKLKAFNSKKK